MKWSGYRADTVHRCACGTYQTANEANEHQPHVLLRTETGPNSLQLNFSRIVNGFYALLTPQKSYSHNGEDYIHMWFLYEGQARSEQSVVVVINMRS